MDFLANHTGVIKIASGDSTFKPLLLKAAKSKAKLYYLLELQQLEILNSINYIKKNSKTNIRKKLVILHCISAYPAPMHELNLNSIRYLSKKTRLYTGYSNHSPNPIAATIALNLVQKL